MIYTDQSVSPLMEPPAFAGGGDLLCDIGDGLEREGAICQRALVLQINIAATVTRGEIIKRFLIAGGEGAGNVGIGTVTKVVEEGLTMFNRAPSGWIVVFVAFDLAADYMMLKGGGVGGKRGGLSRRCLTSQDVEGGGEVD